MLQVRKAMWQVCSRMWRLCGRCPTLVLYFLKRGEEQSTKLHEAALIKLIFRVTSWIVYLARKIFENRILLASAGKCGGLKDGFGNVPGGCGKRPGAPWGLASEPWRLCRSPCGTPQAFR